MKGASDVEEHKPTDDFKEFLKDFDIDIADDHDKEILLFQWPLNSTPDIDGQTLSLDLHSNGILGTFEGSTGKQYEVYSNETRNSGAGVFLPSSSDCQIVGKISRRVSLLHFPDPKELVESNQLVYKKMAEKSVASSMTGSASRFSTPTQGMRSRSSGHRSARTGTVVTGGSGDTSRPPSKRRADKPVRSIDLEDSRRESDSGAPSGSLEQSQERKSKKKRKSEA